MKRTTPTEQAIIRGACHLEEANRKPDDKSAWMEAEQEIVRAVVADRLSKRGKR